MRMRQVDEEGDTGKRMRRGANIAVHVTVTNNGLR